MFQLEGLNRKSLPVLKILERVLHQQMRETRRRGTLAQLLLDSIRHFSSAPTKVVWDAQTNQNRKVINFDPRRCFPDPRVNWGDWDNMQYIVFSDYVSYNSLAYSNMYPKLKMFPALRHKISPPRNAWNAHQWHREEGRGLSIDPAAPHQRERFDHAHFTLGDARVVDEAWVRLVATRSTFHLSTKSSSSSQFSTRTCHPLPTQPIRQAATCGHRWPLPRQPQDLRPVAL